LFDEFERAVRFTGCCVQHSPKSARLDWRIVPAIGRSQGGLNLIGTF
jgi:hypothetical protein